MFLRSVTKGLIIGAISIFGVAHAQDIKPFQPFEISLNKSLNTQFSSVDFEMSTQSSFSSIDGGFDFLSPQKNGYHIAKNNEGIFGDELVLGMKFADWLTLRFNVIDDNSTVDWFTGNALTGFDALTDIDFMGYQVGLSSVLNISNNWRVGIDMGVGRVDSDILGLYQNSIETTRLGLGIRNKKFGATFHSDFMSGKISNELDQSSIDLQVDWYFTKEGTISFGARRNINENTSNGTSIDQLTGTVPYIKFKHNL